MSRPIWSLRARAHTNGTRADPGDGARATERAHERALVHVATVPMTLFFLNGQPAFVRDRCGLSVHAIASPGEMLSRFGETQRVVVHPIRMDRRVTPVRDLASLYRIFRVLRTVRPDIVHAHTPKGGLLGMLAAWLARVPVRVYHVHGMPLVTATGLRARLLRAAERMSCRLAHRVLCVSPWLRALVVEERLCSAAKAKVLLSGSINGVDATDRFRPADATARAEARARWRVPPDAPLIGYVGRVAREKGIVELADAWSRLREELPDLHLMLVGGADDEDPVPEPVLAALRADPRVRFTGQVRNAASAYAALDVVALPTHREGFGMVALEAAAMALPVVASAGTGCVDAVEDGVTGTLVPPRNPVALAEALRRYLSDPALRSRHGAAGRRRVLSEFRREPLWEALAAEYEALLGATRVRRSGRPLRDPAPARAGTPG